MAVRVVWGIGIIIRKGARSCAMAEDFTAEHRKLYGAVSLLEDDDLLSLTIAQSRPEADAAVARLAGLGFQEGADFVLTCRNGVEGPLPRWLSESLGDTGNPPELMAKMEPDVRQMWLDRAPRLYSLVLD